MLHGPGLWNDKQMASWKAVTDTVHAKGCSMICQLVAPGRAADATELKKSGFDLLSSSAVSMPGTGFTETNQLTPISREMTKFEIQDCIHDFAKAAQNAMAAGFDGIEIHGANGYLIDQFLQDRCNKRTDTWGGSITNRCRFGIAVAKACAEKIGSEKVGFRVSPWSPF